MTKPTSSAHACFRQATAFSEIDKDKIIYLMSHTQGVVSQSPEPRAHDKSV